jgi:PIN domain
MVAKVRVIALIDSTELFDNTLLRDAGWESLHKAIKNGSLSVAISEVTILELVRQASEKVDKFNKLYSDSRRNLANHAIELSEFILPNGSFETAFRDRLKRRGVEILPIPRVEHLELLIKDLSETKPFNRSGKGYRDALIWKSFTHWISIQQETGVKEAYFTSSNKNDFASASGRSLHDDLLVDIPAGMSITYIAKLSLLVEKIRDRDDATSQRRRQPLHSQTKYLLQGLARTEFEQFRNISFEDLPVVEPYIDLPDFATATIAAVHIDEDSFRFNLVDSTSDGDIWEVSASGNLAIEGKVHRIEMFPLRPMWSVSTESSSVWIDVDAVIDANFTTNVQVSGREQVGLPSLTSIELHEAEV